MMDVSKITACGECCEGCKKKAEGICIGCIESDGNCQEWAQSGGCPIHKCTRDHGITMCGLCPEFPCEWLVRKVVWRSNVVQELTVLADQIREGERVDLHTHSTYSDGTLTPAELIRLAEEKGLAAVALCDHNTVAGLPAFLKAGEGSSVEAVPGVEFSTDYDGKELHILGLFVRPEHYAAVTGLLDEMVAAKDASNRALCDALTDAGIGLDYETIKAATPNGQVNRALIAADMVRQGYCASVKEAFSQWLSPKRGYYEPPKRPDAFRVIRFIKSIGAVAVLAHPFLNLKEGELRIFLPDAVEAGLDGIETMYPLFDREQTMLAEKIAEEYGLLPSGGSDFHGGNKPDIALGTGKGELNVPAKTLSRLRARARAKES